MNNDAYASEILNPIVRRKKCSSFYHVQGFCLSPYITLQSRHTWLSLSWSMNLGGCIMYTFFSSVLCKKALFTSNWCMFQFLATTTSGTSRIVACFNNEVECLLEIDNRALMNLLATKRALNVSIKPSGKRLIRKIHLFPTTFWTSSGGTRTQSQVRNKSIKLFTHGSTPHEVLVLTLLAQFQREEP